MYMYVLNAVYQLASTCTSSHITTEVHGMDVDVENEVKLLHVQTCTCDDSDILRYGSVP